MIFYYHLLIGEVRTIRNETTYPIHGKYPLNPGAPFNWFSTKSIIVNLTEDYPWPEKMLSKRKWQMVLNTLIKKTIR